jgi:hypothetical protein
MVERILIVEKAYARNTESLDTNCRRPCLRGQQVRWDRSCDGTWSTNSLMTWSSTVSRPQGSPWLAI